MSETKEMEINILEKKLAKAYFNLVESDRFNNLTVFQLKEVAEYIIGTYDRGYEDGLNAANEKKATIYTDMPTDAWIQVRD